MTYADDRNETDPVLVVAPGLTFGGCELYAAGLAKALAASGRRTSLVVHSANQPTFITLVECDGLQVGSIDFMTEPAPRLASLAKGATAAVICLPLPVPEPDGPEPLDLLVSLAEVTHVVAVWQLCHETFHRSPVHRATASALLRRGVKWVCVSQQNAEQMRSMYGLKSGDVQVVLNGVEDGEPAFTGDIRRARRDFLLGRDNIYALLSVGRLVKWKGHETAIRALTLLPAIVHLYIAGTGYDRPRLEALSVELGLAERVHFLGQRSDVRELLKCVDAYVHPSTAEGASFALLEALVTATPVIAAKTASNPELLDGGRLGCLFAPGQPRSLAEQVMSLIASVNLKDKAALAREHVLKHYTRSEMWEGVGRLLASQ
ncbi:glycosyltransferase [Geodermatophilus sp. DF01_2]|uniref:glycosyltransferase n=1 Tax=Geodermatophilus sp. DF01-2 TaxID=2559610 RepID=UPI0014305A5D|nr:glycosyltransferase [Geodermatophilus sp. DF01_2]